MSQLESPNIIPTFDLDAGFKAHKPLVLADEFVASATGFGRIFPDRARIPRDLDNLPKPEVNSLDFRRRHIEEVIHGSSPLPGGTPRPEYSVEEPIGRKVALKASELRNAGIPCSERTIRRWKDKYLQFGEVGLLDGHRHRQEHAFSRADPRVIEALQEVLRSGRKRSDGTLHRVQLQLRANLLDRYPDDAIKLPSHETVRRYTAELERGRYPLGPAVTRLTALNRPEDRVLQGRPVVGPGDEVQYDSSPFDVLALNEVGRAERFHLTIGLCKATDNIVVSAITPVATKGVDIALMMARSMVPRRARPLDTSFVDYQLPEIPWAQELDPSDTEDYERHTPFIRTSRIITDHGADFKSMVVRSAARLLEISISEASPGSPTDKAKVERAFRTIREGFAQYLPGYTGGSVAHRGKNLEDEGLLDVFTIAELFERWIVVRYQHTPVKNDTLGAGVELSPFQKFAAYAADMGMPARRKATVDYIALMPVTYRTVRADGVHLNKRRYDSNALIALHGRTSGDSRHNGKWPVHFDPLNPSAVWIGDPNSGNWIICRWMNGDAFLKPFSASIRNTARQIAREYEVDHDAASIRFLEEIVSKTGRHKTDIEKAHQRESTAQLLRAREGINLQSDVPPDLKAHEVDRAAESKPELGNSKFGDYDPTEDVI
jgi:putative transposase